MISKYTKAVLTVIALSVLALPVKAEEKVWYCEMTGIAQTDDDDAKTFKEERFKFKVTPKEVVFGSGGIFEDEVLPVYFFEHKLVYSRR